MTCDTALSDLNNGCGDCRMVSPPSYLSSPRRKEPWKAFITSPSEELWCIHNATGGELPLASSSRCSASRRTNGRSYVFSDLFPDRRGRKRSPAKDLTTSCRSVARDQERSGYPGRPLNHIQQVMLNAVKHLSAMWPRGSAAQCPQVHPVRTGRGEPVGMALRSFRLAASG